MSTHNMNYVYVEKLENFKIIFKIDQYPKIVGHMCLLANSVDPG